MPRMTRSDRFLLGLATLGPIGHAPVAQGTWGSVAAVLAAPILFIPLAMPWRVLVLAALFVCGALAASRAEVLLGRKDPGQVIIDEVLGQWIVFFPFVAPSTLELAAGLAFFRLFDITKPPPVRASEHWLPRGWGIMLDDALAGVYGCLGLAVLHWLR
jgi:phosphatidylglycerophosphatase A